MSTNRGDGEMELPQQLLLLLESDGDFNSLKVAQNLSVPHQQLIGAIKSLLTNDGVGADGSLQ